MAHDSQGPGTGMPRWVRITGIVVAALIVVVVAMLVIGGGEHGPGRHMGGSGNHGRAAVDSMAP